MNTTRNLHTLATSVACVRDTTVKVGNDLIEKANEQNSKVCLNIFF